MRRTSALSAVLVGLLWARPATADRLEATREQPLREVSHQVDVTIDDGIATYRVRRTIANGGTQAEEARLELSLPPGAAATGLRIRAKDRWYDGELLPADEAAEKYEELTGKGVAKPKDPAILYWQWEDQLGLQIFPIFPGATSTVEYTLTAPAKLRDGHWVVAYPALDREPDSDSLPLADPILAVHAAHADATTGVWFDGERAAADTPVSLAPPPAPQWVGDGYAPYDASFVHAKFEVKAEDPVAWAEVDVAIDHTYRGDLRLELVLPTGTSIPIDDPSGDGNDVRETFKVELPTKVPAKGEWHVRVLDEAGLDVGTFESARLKLQTREKLADGDTPVADVRSGDLPLFVPDAPSGDGVEGLVSVEIEAPSADVMDTRFGRVVVEDTNGFARLDVDAAPEVSKVPRRANVVFVLDGSFSSDDLETQVAVTSAYLSHVPDARVQVVVFRRRATVLFDDFVKASEFGPAIVAARKRGALELGNGSALESGLASAASLLKGRRGPKRIVAASDARMRTRFSLPDAKSAVGAAPRGTVVHVVEPDADHAYGKLRRADTHWLAPLATPSGGLAFDLQLPDRMKDLPEVVLGLVRPVSIDHLEVVGIDPTFIPDPPDALREGEAYRFMVRIDDLPKSVAVRGQLWSRPIRRTVQHTRRFDRATAAWVFSEGEHHDLTEDQMMKIAMFGRAVSPVTSYLAIEPGVRPSTIGLVNTGLIGRGGGGGSGSGYGRGAGAPLLVPIETQLISAVRKCVDQHKPPTDWAVTLEVETTLHEIVDVQPGGPAPQPMVSCVEEAAWALALSRSFQKARETHKMRFDAKKLRHPLRSKP